MIASSSHWEDVSTVIVTYNSAAVIATCLQSVKASKQVIVVDNASTDETCDIIRKILPAAQIIQNKRNRGFGSAVNQGMAIVETDFGFYFSPDAILTDTAMQALTEAAEQYPKTAVFGPYLQNHEGMQELYVMGPDDIRHSSLDTVPGGHFSTWFVMGGFFLCRMTVWRDIGGFDERIFLYNEDVDLCLRFTRGGHHLAVIPNAVVIHAGGQSSKVTWRVKWRKDWHQTWSHLYMMAKYGNPVDAKVKARETLRQQGWKALLYLLLLRFDRVRGNAAKAAAAASYLRGRGAH